MSDIVHVNVPAGPTSQSIAFPPELLLIIIEYAWDRDTSNDSLLACSLVCSEWRLIAQPLLFTVVAIDAPHKAKLFLQTLQSNPRLCRATKILEVFSDVTSQPGGFEIIRDMTKVCFYLYELRIDIPVDTTSKCFLPVFDTKTRMLLQALKLSFDRHIFSETGISGYPINMQNVKHFLNQSTHLSHLTLKGLHKVPMALHFSQDCTPSFHLYEFNWRIGKNAAFVDQQETFQHITHWLFGTKKSDGLRILDVLQHGYSTQELGLTIFEILEDHGSTLHSLRLDLSEAEILGAEVPLSELCPNLRELVVTKCPLSQTLRRMLPVAELESIEFAQGPGESETSVIATRDWILGLPKIQHVTLRMMWDDKATYSSRKFWEKCTAKGIHVEILPQLYAMFMKWKEDPIRVTHFPRSYTVESLRRMAVSSRAYTRHDE